MGGSRFGIGSFDVMTSSTANDDRGGHRFRQNPFDYFGPGAPFDVNADSQMDLEVIAKISDGLGLLGKLFP